MSNRSSEIARLMQITEAAFAAQQANMTRLSRKEDRLRAQIKDLQMARTRRETPLEEDVAARAGADFRWDKWVVGRITSLNTELARVLFEKSRAKSALRLAFGKSQVTGQLYEQARIAQRRDANKRDERGI